MIVVTDKAGVDFGEVWQSKGPTYEVASAAFCPAVKISGDPVRFVQLVASRERQHPR